MKCLPLAKYARFLVPVLVLVLGACAATAQFHSKTGREYAAVAQSAVRCDEQEMPAVMNAGGMIIGTIDAHGMTLQATDGDVADKAAKVAAESGGTHVLLTEKGEEIYTQFNPAQTNTQCQSTDGAVNCQETYTPASTSTYTKPTAKFVVVRVPPENWAKLPETLRPIPPRK
jgi:hypothetical protein